MSYQQVGDVLRDVRALHRKLRDHFEAKAGDATDTRVRFLIEHIAHHEKSLEGCLAALDAKIAAELSKTWLQIVPDQPLHEAFASFRLTDDMSADDVVDAVLALDRALIDFYRALAGNQTTDRVRAIFATVIQKVESRDRDVAKRLAELRDW